MSTKDKIEQILKNNFSIEHLDVSDDSGLHAGHAEAQRQGGGHYSLVIVSTDFQNKTLLQRHKLVYEVLKKELKADIHALAIKALTPQEYHARLSP